MTLIAFNFDKADIGTGRIKRAHQRDALRSREQPIAGKRHDAKARIAIFERGRQIAAIFRRNIEIIHGAGNIEIAIGIKAFDKAHALMAQIALNLKIRIKAVSDFFAVLQIAPEFSLQCGFRQISDMRRHARHSEAFARAIAAVEIAPAFKIRIGQNRLSANLVKGDILRRMARRSSNRHG